MRIFNYLRKIILTLAFATLFVIFLPIGNNDYHADGITIPDGQMYFSPSSENPSTVYWLSGTESVAQFKYVIVDFDGNYKDKNRNIITDLQDFPAGKTNGVLIYPGDKLYLFNVANHLNDESSYISSNDPEDYTRIRCTDKTSIQGNFTSIIEDDDYFFAFIFGSWDESGNDDDVHFTSAPIMDLDRYFDEAFKGAFARTEIVEAPIFPGHFWTSNKRAFYRTFYKCPELRTLAEIGHYNNGINEMVYKETYYGCPNIKLSETRVYYYNVNWKVDSNEENNTHSAQNDSDGHGPTYNMLAGTGGTFTDDPQLTQINYPNVTHYGIYYAWRYPVTVSTIIPLNTIYNGNSQRLIMPPAQINGGTKIEYAVSDNNSTAPSTGWSESIPEETEVGKYYVWYRTTTDANHYDVDPKYIEVNIYDEITRKDLTYTGTSQVLVNAPDPSLLSGTIEYASGTYTAPTSAWSTTVPAQTNAGDYYIWYRYVTSYSTSTPKSVYCMIAKADLTPSLEYGTAIYTGSALTPAVGFSGLQNGETFSSPTDYTVTYSNNTDIGTANVSISINTTDKTKNYNLLNSSLTFTITNTINLTDQVYFAPSGTEPTTVYWIRGSKTDPYCNFTYLILKKDDDKYYDKDGNEISNTLPFPDGKANGITVDIGEKLYIFNSSALINAISDSEISDILTDLDTNSSYFTKIRCTEKTAIHGRWYKLFQYSSVGGVGGYFPFSFAYLFGDVGTDPDTCDDLHFTSIFDGAPITSEIGAYGCYRMFAGTDIVDIPADVHPGDSDIYHGFLEDVHPRSSKGVFKEMFANCKELTYASSICQRDYRDLKEDQFVSMFSGCSKLQFSNVMDYQYNVPFKVDVSISGGTVENTATKNIILGTGGVYTDTIKPRFEYYQKRLDASCSAVIPADFRDEINYDGNSHKLIYTAPEDLYGAHKILYAVSDNGTSAPTNDSDWSENIPSKTDAGHYYVWYKLVPDRAHNQGTPKYVEVDIIGGTPVIENLTASSVTYNKENQNLTSDPTVTGGTIQYALSVDNVTEPSAGNFSDAIPTGKDVGLYYVWYKVAPDAGYIAIPPTYLGSTSEIKKKDISVEPENTSVVFTGGHTGQDNPVKFVGLVDGDTLAPVSGTNPNGDYIVDYANDINVGTATITVTLQPTDVTKNYNLTNTTTSYTITQKINLVPQLADSDKSITYTGSVDDVKPQVSEWVGLLAGDTLTEGTDYEIDWTDDPSGDPVTKNVGNKIATVTLLSTTTADKYNIETEKQKLQYVVKKADVYPEFNVDLSYTGHAHEPDVDWVGVVGSEELTKPADYTISYLYNTDAGTATAVVTFTATSFLSPNYNLLNGNLTFKIKPVTLTTLINPDSFDYDGTPKEPTVTFTGLVNGETFTINQDYLVNYENNINVGQETAKAKILLISGSKAKNYTLGSGEEEKKFSIGKQEPNVTISANTVEYNGNPQNLVTASTDGGTLYFSLGTSSTTDGGTWSENIPQETNVGDYYVFYKVIGGDNFNDLGSTYAGSVSKITKKTVEPSLQYTTVQYDGTEKNPTISWSGGVTLTEGIDSDYTVARDSDLTSAGTKNFEITLTNTNYDMSPNPKTLSYEITANPPTVTGLSAKTQTYNRTDLPLVTTPTVTGGTIKYIVGTDGTTAPSSTDSGWSTSIPGKTDVGEYHVWYKVDGNVGYSDIDPTYVGSSSVINKCVVYPILDHTQFNYDGNDKVPTVSSWIGLIDPDTLTSGSDFTLTPPSGDKSSVGEKTVTITLNSTVANYRLSSGSSIEMTYKIVGAVEPSYDPDAEVVSSALTYNGQEQPLIQTPGGADGGTYWYGIICDDPTNEPTTWVQDSQYVTGKNAGTYYIWKKIVGDNSHSDKAPEHLDSVVINKAVPTYPAPTSPQSAEVEYYGPASGTAAQGHRIVSSITYPTWSEGTFTYTITSPVGNDFAIDSEGKLRVRDGVSIGSHPITISVKSPATTNYTEKENTIVLNLTVKQGSINVNANNPQFVLGDGNTEKELIENDVSIVSNDGNNPLNYSVQYAAGNSGSTAPTSGWSSSKPKGKDLGSYYVWYRVVLNSDSDKYDYPNNGTEQCLGRVRLVTDVQPQPQPQPQQPSSGGSTNDGEEVIKYIYVKDKDTTKPNEDTTKPITNPTVDDDGSSSSGSIFDGNPFVGVGGVFSFILLLLILLLLLLILFLKRRKDQEEENQEELYYY